MSFEIFDSPLYRKAMEYHEDSENYNTLIDEVNQAEGEYNEQIEPVNAKIESLEEMRKRVEEDGVDRGMVTTIQEIVGNDEMLESRGLSLESFTLVPSRVNVSVALEELSSEHKNLLLAGLIGAAVVLIGKIIHSVYKFFKNRKTSASSTAELKDNVAKKIQEVKMAENELKELAAKDAEIKKAYEEAQDALAESKVRIDEAVEDACTGLIQKVVKDPQTKDLVAKVFDQFEPYVKSIVAYKDGALELNGSMKTWIEDGTIDNHITELYELALGKTPPQSMRKNIRDLAEKIDRLLDLSKDTPEPDDAFRDKMVEFVQTKRDLGFINNIVSWDKIENTQHLNESSFLKLTAVTDDLNKRVLEIDKEYAGKVSKETAIKIKDYVNYFKEVTQIYLKMVTLFQQIVNGWNRMLRAVDNQANWYAKLLRYVGTKIKIGKNEYDKHKYLVKYFSNGAKTGG